MGFFDGLKKFCSDAYNGAKDVASEIKEDAKRAAIWTGKKIQKGATWVADKLDSVLTKDPPQYGLEVLQVVQDLRHLIVIMVKKKRLKKFVKLKMPLNGMV